MTARDRALLWVRKIIPGATDENKTAAVRGYIAGYRAARTKNGAKAQDE